MQCDTTTKAEIETTCEKTACEKSMRVRLGNRPIGIRLTDLWAEQAIPASAVRKRIKELQIKENGMTMEDVKKKLDGVTEIACANGNWDHDPYLYGMANGLILARSIVAGEEPEFLEAPDQWLRDREETL